MSISMRNRRKQNTSKYYHGVITKCLHDCVYDGSRITYLGNTSGGAPGACRCRSVRVDSDIMCYGAKCVCKKNNVPCTPECNCFCLCTDSSKNLFNCCSNQDKDVKHVNAGGELLPHTRATQLEKILINNMHLKSVAVSAIHLTDEHKNRIVQDMHGDYIPWKQLSACAIEKTASRDVSVECAKNTSTVPKLPPPHNVCERRMQFMIDKFTTDMRALISTIQTHSHESVAVKAIRSHLDKCVSELNITREQIMDNETHVLPQPLPTEQPSAMFESCIDQAFFDQRCQLKEGEPHLFVTPQPPKKEEVEMTDEEADALIAQLIAINENDDGDDAAPQNSNQANNGPKTHFGLVFADELKPPKRKRQKKISK